MPNWGGALGGAATGAQLGSGFGPAGIAVGGILGGVAGLFGGGKKRPKKRSTFDKQQQGLYKDYVSAIRGQGPFSNLYKYDAAQANNVFDLNVARPAYRSFQENVIPQITGQFRSNNLMNSSYAGEALARRGRDVQENLDALRAAQQFEGQQAAQNRQQQGLQHILGLTTYDNVQRPPSTIDQILGGVAPLAGQTFSNYLSSRNQNNLAGPQSTIGSMNDSVLRAANIF
jgi:hypothetical protein